MLFGRLRATALFALVTFLGSATATLAHEFPITPGKILTIVLDGTLGLRDHVFCGATNRLGFGASRRDPLVLEKLSDQRAAQRIPLPRAATQFLPSYLMSHRPSDVCVLDIEYVFSQYPGIERVSQPGLILS